MHDGSATDGAPSMERQRAILEHAGWQEESVGHVCDDCQRRSRAKTCLRKRAPVRVHGATTGTSFPMHRKLERVHSQALWVLTNASTLQQLSLFARLSKSVRFREGFQIERRPGSCATAVPSRCKCQRRHCERTDSG